jgi:hypothetical protein
MDAETFRPKCKASSCTNRKRTWSNGERAGLFKVPTIVYVCALNCPSLLCPPIVQLELNQHNQSGAVGIRYCTKIHSGYQDGYQSWQSHNYFKNQIPSYYIYNHSSQFFERIKYPPKNLSSLCWFFHETRVSLNTKHLYHAYIYLSMDVNNHQSNWWKHEKWNSKAQ